MATDSGTQVTGFPNAGEAFVDERGVLTRPWQRFLANLWNKVGGGNSVANAVYLVVQNATIRAYQAVSGQFLGEVVLVGQLGEAAVPQHPVGSPFVFTSPGTGTLVVESGQVELSRDGGMSWYITGLAGGAIPVLIQDKVRTTWYNAVPKITFFPN